MKHNPHVLAAAAALTTGIAYSIRMALLVFAREYFLKIHAYKMGLANLDMFAQNIQVTATSFIVGLLSVVIWTYVIVMIFAWIYRMLCAHCGEGCHCGGNGSSCGCGSKGSMSR